MDGFAAPGWFALVAGLVVLGAGYGCVARRRRRYLMRFANLALLERVAPRRPGWGRHVSPALLAVALLLLIVALAGPVARCRCRATGRWCCW